MRSVFIFISTFSLAVLSGFSLLGCNETDAIRDWFNTLQNRKSSVRQVIGQTPYQTNQHKILKAYFGELVEKVFALKNTEAFAAALNEVLSQENLAQICGKVFLTQLEWNTIMQNCTRNRFFLCAEEVRAYPDMIFAVRQSLDTDLRKKFDQTATCQMR